MAIRATLRMTVRPGGEQDFLNAWLRIAAEVSRHQGCLRQALLSDHRTPRTYLVTSDWETREAFHAFETSTAQDVLTAPLRELRESVEMTLDEILHHT